MTPGGPLEALRRFPRDVIQGWCNTGRAVVRWLEDGAPGALLLAIVVASLLVGLA